MIKLYYTGASQNLEPQKEMHKSLGGYISSTIIPNNRFNTIFRDESLYGKKKNSEEVICISIKNENNTVLKSLELFAEIATDYNISVAVVKPTLDSCSNPIFEKIDSQEEMPYYGEFNDITLISNKIIIGDLEANSYLGIFLKKTKTSSYNNCHAIDFSEQKTEDTIESFKLNFSWD